MAPECFACPEGDRLRWTDRLDIICLGRCSCTNQVSSVSLSVLCRQRMNISPVTQRKKKKEKAALQQHQPPQHHSLQATFRPAVLPEGSLAPSNRVALKRPLDPVSDLGGQQGRAGSGHTTAEPMQVEPSLPAADQVTTSAAVPAADTVPLASPPEFTDASMLQASPASVHQYQNPMNISPVTQKKKKKKNPMRQYRTSMHHQNRATGYEADRSQISSSFSPVPDCSVRIEAKTPL